MLYVYTGCLTFGIIYSIVSAIFGSHGIGHSLDHGGIDGHSADTPSPFSPLVIASAITAFGAIGLIGKLGFKMGELLSVVFALMFAGIVGAAIFFGVVKLVYGSQSNSTFSLLDLVGTEAEVITPIPANGVGEIAYVANGMRYNITAKSFSNEDVGRGTEVIIKDIIGNIAIVTKKMTIDDIEAFEFENMRRVKEENNEQY